MIPKTIHQIWVGNKRIPTHIKDNLLNMMKINGQYEYKLWTDNNLPKMPETIQMVYDSHIEPAHKADVLRLWVCYEYGGIYLDVDFVPKKPIDIDFDTYESFLTYHRVEDKIEHLPNAILGSARHSNLFTHFISEIQHKNQWLGPNYIAQSVCRYMGLDNETTNSNTLTTKFEEYRIKGVTWQDFNETYTEHVNLASWYPNSEWNIKFKDDNYD